MQVNDSVQKYFDNLSDSETGSTSSGLSDNVTAMPPTLTTVRPLNLSPSQWDNYQLDAKATEVTLTLKRGNMVVLAIEAPTFSAALGFLAAFNELKCPEEKPAKKPVGRPKKQK